MSEKPATNNRVIHPGEGWQNIFASRDCGQSQFNQGRVYEASYGDRPVLHLVHVPVDNEIIVRCALCDVKSLAFDSFQDYPMIGIVKISARRMTLTMNTGRILNHLQTEHEERLGGVDDVDFFNSVLACCNL